MRVKMTDTKEEVVKEEEKKTDEEILFAEQDINGIMVKPWSFGILFEITEDLEAILSKLDEADIDIDTILTNGITWKNMVRLFTVASPHVFRIIQLTVSKDEDTVKALSLEDGIKIALLIYSQNRDQIKNALSLTQ